MKTLSHIFCIFFISAVSSLILSASAGSADIPDAPAAPAGSAPVTESAAKTSPSTADPPGRITPVVMYSQGDPAWESYLYGGRDSMAAYGCGPTALAIAVASLTGQDITPVDTAKWSCANGYYSPGKGSVHRLIPHGAQNYGLKVEKLTVLTPDAFRIVLSENKLLILLMGPGDFSDYGHFIVAYGYDGSKNILIADPASTERSLAAWPAETLISQLSASAEDGGPVWVLSKP